MPVARVKREAGGRGDLLEDMETKVEVVLAGVIFLVAQALERMAAMAKMVVIMDTVLPVTMEVLGIPAR